jgi:hypothetical protein
MDDPAAGQDYTDGGEDYSDAAAAATNVTTGKAAAAGGKAAAAAGGKAAAAAGKAAGGKEAAHDEDRIVNGYSVDGRPWYVAFQVNDLLLKVRSTVSF